MTLALPATLIVTSDGIPIPTPDFTLLEGNSGLGLRSVVGMILVVALIACGLAIIIGVSGWIAGRGRANPQTQSKFGTMAALGFAAAFLIGSLTAANTWGIRDQIKTWSGGNHATFSPGGVAPDGVGDLPDGSDNGVLGTPQPWTPPTP